MVSSLVLSVLLSQTGAPPQNNAKTVVKNGVIGMQVDKRFTAAADIFKDFFGIAVPKSVKVTQFEPHVLFLDPSFAWELSPVDRAFVRNLVTSAKLKATSPSDMTRRWPAWFPEKKLATFKESYSREFEDGGHRHIWVDAATNRIYAEFQGM